MLQNSPSVQFDGHTYNHLQDSFRLHAAKVSYEEVGQVHHDSQAVIRH